MTATAETEQAARYKDFDQVWAESKREPLTIKVFGEVEQLPDSLPAGVVFEVVRLQAAKGNALDERDIVTIAIKLFTPERVDRWADKGLSITQLSDLVNHALKEYGVNNPGSAKGKSSGKKA